MSRTGSPKIVITWLILPTHIYDYQWHDRYNFFKLFLARLWAIRLINFRAIHWVVFEPLQNFWKERKSKWRLNDVIFRIIPIPFSSQFSFWLDHVSLLLIPYLFFQIIRENNNNNNNNNPNDFNMSFKKILKAIIIIIIIIIITRGYNRTNGYMAFKIKLIWLKK